MEPEKTRIEIEVPSKIRALLAEKARQCGMDESSYTTKVIIDYLRLLSESRRDTGSKSE